MAKWGHKEGQGLGTNASGIVEPLSVQVAKAPKKGNQKPSAGGFGAEGSKIAKIVNKQEEERVKAERAKYGDPSTVVVLSNMVSLEDADDEDLSYEIGSRFKFLLFFSHFTLSFLQGVSATSTASLTGSLYTSSTLFPPISMKLFESLYSSRVQWLRGNQFGTLMVGILAEGVYEHDTSLRTYSLSIN